MRKPALRVLLAAGVAAVAAPAMALGEDFTDVPSDAYYADSVEAITGDGIAAGTGGGRYDPDNPVTRGQIAVFLNRVIAARPATFVAFLNGANEVPGPGDPDGMGSALVHVGRDSVCFEVTTAGIEPWLAAHIHAGAADVAGPVVVDFTVLLEPLPEDGFAAACVEGDTEVLRQIRSHPGDYYVNVHTASFPAGAVRGQLGTL